MHLSPDESNQFSLSRFESMLQTNDVYFFDSEEFEEIIHHYLENGKIALAKKATKLGLAQHPTSMNLKLFEVEMMIFENKLDHAEELLDQLYILEQSNEEIFIQKANLKKIEFYVLIIVFTEERSQLFLLAIIKKLQKVLVQKQTALTILTLETIRV